MLIKQSNAQTLKKATYGIRTKLEVSKDGYSHSGEYPINSTGQGSGNMPMIWCFLSRVLFNCYDQSSFKATHCCPDLAHNGIGYD
jgi:hypothetical protein